MVNSGLEVRGLAFAGIALWLWLLGFAGLHKYVQVREEISDGDLADRIRQGDEPAFRTLFERHHRALLGYVRRMGLDDAVAKDLVQNAFVSLWDRRAELRADKSVRALLYRIVTTRGLNHVRDTGRLDNLAAADELVDATGDHAEYALMLDRLSRVVQNLPERRRLVFQLCFVERLTYRDAGEALGLSVKTIENQMAHALKTVRAAFEDYRES